MIVTVTLNPSLDRTLAVAELVHGEVIRAESTMEDPGGKGVNVTRFLVARGTASVAVLPAGGSIGRALVGALSEAGIPHRAVPISGATRSNVTVVEPDGTTTKLNEPGPALSAAEVEGLVAAVAERVTPGGWVVVAGSLPADLDTAIVHHLAEVARAAGARFALDASGAALADGLAARPDLIKPNAEELGEVLGRPLTTLDDVLAGCDEARARGAAAVICSLGAEGAVLVDGQGRWHATGPSVPVVSTVGAGDSVLAGFLHGGGAGPEALRVGIAWATAAVQTPGTGVPDAALIDPAAVVVAELPRGTPHAPVGVTPAPA
ncbi:MAG: 1-phosphofructokinase [Candidatus Nanopelagicales bacterium]|jgi:1-phosphofructokinase|nr:1-phosphofructokinase [Candidatus Nanopelagicales bacterium]